MLVFPYIVILLILVCAWRFGGPLVSLCISWLVVITPIVFGLVQFQLMSELDPWFELTLVMYIFCFVGGVLAYRIVSGRRHATKEIFIRESVTQNIRLAKFCMLLGWCGVVLLCVNFLTKGYNLSNLTALHAQFGPGEGSVLVALTNVSIWACLYCYIFVLLYWRRLNAGWRLLILSPVPGYLLTGLLTGGRQPFFIVMLITILTFVLKIRGQNSGVVTTKHKLIVMAIVVFAVGSYSLFVGVARNNNQISVDHAVVLRFLFSYRTTDLHEAIFSWNKALSDFTEMFFAYFSATIPQFRTFLSTSLPLGYGASDYPFLARQLTPITGIDYFSVLSDKRTAMQIAGAAQAGWPTAISSAIADFGRFGAAVYLFIQGLYAEYIWARVRRTGKLLDYIVLILVMISAIYMPALPLTTDTSCFLLWIFCISVNYIDSRFEQRFPRPVPRRSRRATQNALADRDAVRASSPTRFRGRVL